MTPLSGIAVNTTSTLPLTASGASAKPGATSAEDAKIDKSARDFEAILLSNWLQQAEASFATVPGSDDDEDGASSQFTQMAMQSLGTSFAGTGGIGIAKMIAAQLHKTEGTTGVAAGTENHSPATLPPHQNFLPPALNSSKEWPIE